MTLLLRIRGKIFLGGIYPPLGPRLAPMPSFVIFIKNHEEVTYVADNESIQRYDIIVIDKINV